MRRIIMLTVFFDMQLREFDRPCLEKTKRTTT
jgi:hypothetical protein